jgi:uncharacterized protein involved in exopolysaccharide biosynthesis
MNSPPVRAEVLVNSAEIDVFQLIKKLITYWKILVSSAFFGGAIGLIYIFIASPVYEANTTFFVTEMNARMPNALSSYSSFFGGDLGNNSEGYISEILKSNQLAYLISSATVERYPKILEIAKELKGFPNTLNRQIEFVSLRLLRLDKKLQSDKSRDGLFSLSFQYSNSNITLFVLETALAEMLGIYKKMNLTVSADIISILDSPQLKIKPVSPQKSLIVILATLFGGVIGMVFVFFKLNIRDSN